MLKLLDKSYITRYVLNIVPTNSNIHKSKLPIIDPFLSLRVEDYILIMTNKARFICTMTFKLGSAKVSEEHSVFV